MRKTKSKKKSKKDWLQLDDRNSRFFHSATKVRQHKNHIHHLLNVDGDLINDMKIIKQQADDYYQNLFNQDNYATSFPELVVKKILTDDAKAWLLRPFTLKETKNAVFQMNPDKAPGPYGFNASFYQKNWEIIGQSIYEAVASFFTNGKLLKKVNHTFLTLIPRVNNSCNKLISDQFLAAIYSTR